MKKNAEIVNLFREIAGILKIKGENPFKIRAYERVADTIENLSMEIETIYHAGKLNEIPGVGEAISSKMKEFLQTGQLEYLERLKMDIPTGVLELLKIPEIGPKKAKKFYEELGIDHIEKLEKAALEHKLQSLPGMGKKAEENILKGIQLYKRRGKRTLLNEALSLAEEVVKELSKLEEVEEISIAGSLRRQKETIGDIDILIASNNPEKVMKALIQLPQSREVLAEGITKSAILTEQDIQIDLRVVEKESFGAALQYFTGSKSHNVRLREMAAKQQLKVNEYGLFRVIDGQKIAGRSEKEVYEKLGLSYIMPELREDRGEFEAAVQKKLPELVEAGDIKGDLHIHTTDSDGMNSILEITNASIERGYEYIAITDHSQSLTIAGGLNIQKLKDQMDKIDQINRDLKKLVILKGVEVDIKSDGTLDLPDDILSQLDIVIAAIHSGFKQDTDQIMNRLTSAMKNPYVHIIAHPTGRIINYRNPYQVDIDRLIQVASETNTVLEINASPERMDLTDVHTRKAKENGVSISIGTDAHQIKSLNHMAFGVAIAHRGWLEKKNLINTLSLRNLLKKLKKFQKAK